MLNADADQLNLDTIDTLDTADTADAVDAVGVPSREDADRAIAVALAYVGSLPARAAVPCIAAYRARLDAAEATALASVVGDDGNTKRAETITGNGGKTSKRTRRRTAKRAAAVKQNAGLAKKVADGDLSAEHLDVLADAANKTGGASLADKDLIAKVAAANPDLGKSIIDEYLLDKEGAAGEQRRHDRQRRARRVSRFRTKDDLEALMIAGDKATIDRIWNQTTSIANAMYEQDGGRDIPGDQHARSHDQRMFDALTDSIIKDEPEADAVEAPTAPATSKPTSSRRTTPKKNKQNKKATSRPTIVITATLDKLLGLDPKQAAELIGSGPVADSVLAQYLGADANIIGAIFSTDGEPLWLGRNIRLATAGQFIGLVIRDKHCVLCGAHHTRCRAHHIQPWNAPESGETNINNLVLVCDTCHRYIHDNTQTIYKERKTRLWKLRPALPHETPPPRPVTPARE